VAKTRGDETGAAQIRILQLGVHEVKFRGRPAISPICQDFCSVRCARVASIVTDRDAGIVRAS
jgi:hypothetical protein